MYIASTGMVCSVGLTAQAACAAMRAGITNFQELPYLDNQGEPIIGAMVPGLAPDLKRGERLGELLSMAITDCLKDKVNDPLEQIPLLVGLAEPDRPGGGAGLAASIVKPVQGRLAVRFHPKLSRAFANGHTAGFEALRVGRELLKNGDVPACLVCGVDSYVNAAALHWLDRHFRLKTPGNQHALIPGEAAAAVLLQRTPATGVSVEVIGLGFGKEKAHVLSEEPLLGLGLTAAARAALAEAKLGLHEIDLRISDVTGEHYGFKELPLLEGRLMRVVRKQDQPVWHWSDAIGDTGAAAGVAQLVMADQAFRKGYAPGDTAICLTSSVPGDRVAAVLRRRPR